jgi:hypothetical protein
MRSSMRAMGEKWTIDLLPEHFLPSAYGAFGYQTRKPKYLKIKDKEFRIGAIDKRTGRRVIAGADTPLVRTGYLREKLLLSRNMIRAYPSRVVTIDLVGPAYFTLRPWKSKTTVLIAREVLAVNNGARAKAGPRGRAGLRRQAQCEIRRSGQLRHTHRSPLPRGTLMTTDRCLLSPRDPSRACTRGASCSRFTLARMTLSRRITSSIWSSSRRARSGPSSPARIWRARTCGSARRSWGRCFSVADCRRLLRGPQPDGRQQERGLRDRPATTRRAKKGARGVPDAKHRPTCGSAAIATRCWSSSRSRPATGSWPKARCRLVVRPPRQRQRSARPGRRRRAERPEHRRQSSTRSARWQGQRRHAQGRQRVDARQQHRVRAGLVRAATAFSPTLGIKNYRPVLTAFLTRQTDYLATFGTRGDAADVADGLSQEQAGQRDQRPRQQSPFRTSRIRERRLRHGEGPPRPERPAPSASSAIDHGPVERQHAGLLDRRQPANHLIAGVRRQGANDQ